MSLRTSSRSRRSSSIADRTAARSCASGPAVVIPMETVFPNPAARDEFQARAGKTTNARPLVSMDGKMGSYLLQELAIWVCGQLRERNFRHDVWVMAPVYERGALYLGGHFLSTVLLDPARRLAPVPRLGRLLGDSGRARQPRRANPDPDGHGR